MNLTKVSSNPRRRNRSFISKRIKSGLGFECIYCSKTLRVHRFCPKQKSDSVTVDHWVPICKNGSKQRHNLVFACPNCNHKKDNMNPLDSNSDFWKKFLPSRFEISLRNFNFSGEQINLISFL